ncbi:MAG TPA: histidine kinase dimerization/phospho-acceptor domain-containing protein [Gemmatimonadales bacterium]|jgi:signal transduction histidine kinase
MPISRLRLELAAWFAVAVLVAVSAVDVGLTGYLQRQAGARFDHELSDAAAGLLVAVRQEEHTGATPLGAATDALSEWPASLDAFVVYTAGGSIIGSRGDSALLALAALPAPNGPSVWERRVGTGSARLALATDRVAPPLRVVAVRPTAELAKFGELLTNWLVFSIPGVTAVSLVAGYFLARRALRPLNAVTDQISTIDPADLAGRLPTRTPPDEIDRLAEHFNALLARVAALRQQNQDFLSRVAHQLRTPLTLVRGESELGLERERDAGTYRAILTRIGRAANQMSQRVDDLFLLAHAEAGDRPPLDDSVELDALALECTDLMRARAQKAQRSLALDRVSGDAAMGNATLLREVLLELLENAIRHGSDQEPIRVSAFAEDDRAHLIVANPGPALNGAPSASAGGRGLGLSIVAWIAQVHEGTVAVTRTDGVNAFDVSWPQRLNGSAAPNG